MRRNRPCLVCMCGTRCHDSVQQLSTAGRRGFCELDFMLGQPDPPAGSGQRPTSANTPRKACLVPQISFLQVHSDKPVSTELGGHRKDGKTGYFQKAAAKSASYVACRCRKPAPQGPSLLQLVSINSRWLGAPGMCAMAGGSGLAHQSNRPKPPFCLLKLRLGGGRRAETCRRRPGQPCGPWAACACAAARHAACRWTTGAQEAPFLVCRAFCVAPHL